MITTIFTVITIFLISLIKASGSYISLYFAHQLFQIAFISGGLYIVLYIPALYLVALAMLCVYTSFVECSASIEELFEDDDDGDV